MKTPKEADPRFKALLPQLEALPRELRDGLIQILESAVQVHQLIEPGRKVRRQRKLRPGRGSSEND